MPKIGILGSGDVGKSLARGFLKHGYQVMIGSDHKEKLADFQKENSELKIGTFEEAAGFGEIVIISVKGTAGEKVVNEVKNQLSGKVVIDTMNPIADAPPEKGVLKYFTSLENSLMERLQKIAPDARFVKAFNSVGHAFMVNPEFGERPTMFICGNDAEAKNQVTKILEKFGFEVEDMGMAESAIAIEPLCILWCIPGFLKNDWNHAFKLLKK